MRYRPITVAILLLTCVAGCVAIAQPLSLSQAIGRARTSHPAIQIALSELLATKARASMRNAQFLPQLSLNGIAATGDGSMIFPTTVMPLNYSLLPTDSVGVLNGTAMWRIWTAGRDNIAKQIGLTEVNEYVAQVKQIEVNVDFAVRDAFSNYIFRMDVLKARQAALDAAREMLRVTKARFDVGSVPKAFVLRAEADVAGMEREIAMAQSDIGMADAMLRESIGIDQLEELLFGGWDQDLLAPATKKEAIETAMKAHPELISARLSLDISRLKGKDASRSLLPEASLMAMGDWMGARMMPSSATSKVGLVVSFPFGDGGERKAAKAEAEAMTKKMSQELRMRELQIQANVASAFAAWESVPAQRKASQAQLAASEEGFRVMKERYEAGKAVLVELIDARAQWIIARVGVAEVETYARASWARLMRAMGSEVND